MTTVAYPPLHQPLRLTPPGSRNLSFPTTLPVTPPSGDPPRFLSPAGSMNLLAGDSSNCSRRMPWISRNPTCTAAVDLPRRARSRPWHPSGACKLSTILTRFRMCISRLRRPTALCWSIFRPPAGRHRSQLPNPYLLVSPSWKEEPCVPPTSRAWDFNSTDLDSRSFQRDSPFVFAKQCSQRVERRITLTRGEILILFSSPIVRVSFFFKSTAAWPLVALPIRERIEIPTVAID